MFTATVSRIERSIETLQSALHVGIFDIDDVILNTLGVVIGCWTVVIVRRWMRGRTTKKLVATVSLITACIAGAWFVIAPI